MQRSTVYAMSLGFAVTAAAVAVDVLGGFQSWERRTIDLRFTRPGRPVEPMSNDIAHLDIDDRALETVGWPIDRSLLADAVDELRIAGAKTIALDVLLIDETKYPEGTERSEVDHDGRLAEALDQANVTLPVITTDLRLHELWETPRGAEELNRLLDLLGENIQRSDAEALDLARVTGRRRARHARRPQLFREAAAWRALRRAEHPVPDFEAYERLVTPDRDRDDVSYLERKVLIKVWRRHHAWQVVRPHLLPDPSRGHFRNMPPLARFAEPANAIGFTDFDNDHHPDRVIREMPVRRPGPGGAAIQLGLAAALLHLGHSVRDVALTDDGLIVGDVELPLRDGWLWIRWPTSTTDPRWEGLLRRTEHDTESAGHISLGEVVELARARRKHERNLEALREVTGMILEVADITFEPGDELAHLADARSEVAYVLEDLASAESDDAADEQLEPLAPEEKAAHLDHVHNCRVWSRTDAEVASGARQILEGAQKLLGLVEDKLVFMGWTATGAVADFVNTPIGAGTPGVVVHAAIANMVLTNSSVEFLPAWEGWILTLCLGLLATFAAARLPTWLSITVAGASVLVYLGVGGIWFFDQRAIVMPLTAPLTAGATSWIACTALQAALAQRDRTRITRQFKARVSSQLVDHLVENPDAHSVSGEEREVSVLFGDIAGFTAVSEILGGPATVSTLNGYMGALADVLVQHAAYVNKFLGDGIMAFWSAFRPDDKQAGRACTSALECIKAVDRLNGDPRFVDTPDLVLRLGIATGRVVVGDCGAPPELNDYTVIGDAVNLAARLESANKQFGTHALVNARTKELVGDAPIRLRPIGRVIVLGQTVPVDVFEVLPVDAADALIELSEELTQALVGRDLGQMVSLLDKLEDRFGPTKLTRLYRRTVANSDDRFEGVLHLSEK